MFYLPRHSLERFQDEGFSILWGKLPEQEQAIPELASIPRYATHILLAQTQPSSLGSGLAKSFLIFSQLILFVVAPCTGSFLLSSHRNINPLSTKWIKSQNPKSLIVPLRRHHDSLSNNEWSTVDQKVTQNHFSYFLEVHRMATSQTKSAPQHVAAQKISKNVIICQTAAKPEKWINRLRHFMFFKVKAIFLNLICSFIAALAGE